MKRSRGFTIIELLVVIAIMAILASVAIPSFTKFIEQARVRGAAEMVYEQFMFAKTEAIKRSKPITVQFSVNGGDPWAMGITDDDTTCDEDSVTSCAITDYDNDNDEVEDDSVAMFITDAKFTNVVATQNFNANNSGFDPLRGAALDGANGAGRVTLTTTNSQYEVRVNVSEAGSITLCSPAAKKVSGYPDC